MTISNQERGLISPRRRTEREPATVPADQGEIHVISSLPAVVRMDTAHREKRKKADKVPPATESASGEFPRELATQDTPTRNSATIHRVDIPRADAVANAAQKGEPQKGGFFSALANYPWNNVLLGASLAALFWVAILAVSKFRNHESVPQIPPEVHYHIVPPPQFTAQPVITHQMTSQPTRTTETPAASAAKSPASANDTPRIAQRQPNVAGPQAYTIDEPYPKTDFPQLSLSPPDAVDVSEDTPTPSGAKLSGTIQQFEK